MLCKDVTRRRIFGCRTGNDSPTREHDRVLSIVYRAISTPLIRKVGYAGKTADSGAVGEVAGFNLHAGVAARADQRRKLGRLCRYITRPAVSERRQSLTAQGKVRYELKTPYNAGPARSG